MNGLTLNTLIYNFFNLNNFWLDSFLFIYLCYFNEWVMLFKYHNLIPYTTNILYKHIYIYTLTLSIRYLYTMSIQYKFKNHFSYVPKKWKTFSVNQAYIPRVSFEVSTLTFGLALFYINRTESWPFSSTLETAKTRLLWPWQLQPKAFRN